jgi:hypothetical protein
MSELHLKTATSGTYALAQDAEKERIRSKGIVMLKENQTPDMKEENASSDAQLKELIAESKS